LETSKRLTIRDVAAAAGVSTQTVSRVINDRPDVAPETFSRVREVIRKTGYTPNMVARSLIQGRSHVLGVVASGIEYFGPSRIITGIERQADAMGYSISLSLVLEPQTEDVERILDGLKSRQVDGVVWAIPEIGKNRAWCRLQSSRLQVPVVLVGGMIGKPYLPSIGIDNETIGHVATDYLIAGGATTVGIITGPSSWCEAGERLRGWRQSLEAHDLDAADSLVFEGDWTASSGEQGLRELLDRRPEIDAVFASNDQIALGVLQEAHRRGKKIPDELSVVGVDDIEEAAHFWPPLTTLRQPLYESGVLAVQEIDRLICQEQPSRSSSDVDARIRSSLRFRACGAREQPARTRRQLSGLPPENRRRITADSNRAGGLSTGSILTFPTRVSVAAGIDPRDNAGQSRAWLEPWTDQTLRLTTFSRRSWPPETGFGLISPDCHPGLQVDETQLAAEDGLAQLAVPA
jgi:LacI family transcriptional regulator